MIKAKINFSESIGFDDSGWSKYWKKEIKEIEIIIRKKIIDFPITPKKGMLISLSSFDFGLNKYQKECLSHTILFKVRWLVVCEGYVEIWCNDLNEEGDE